MRRESRRNPGTPTRYAAAPRPEISARDPHRVEGVSYCAQLVRDGRAVVLFGEFHDSEASVRSTSDPHYTDLVAAYQRAYGDRFAHYAEYPPEPENMGREPRGLSQPYHGYLGDSIMEHLHDMGAVGIDPREYTYLPRQASIARYRSALHRMTGHDFIEGVTTGPGDLSTDEAARAEILSDMADLGPRDAYDLLLEYYTLGVLEKERADIVFIFTGSWHAGNLTRYLQGLGYDLRHVTGDPDTHVRKIRVPPV